MWGLGWHAVLVCLCEHMGCMQYVVCGSRTFPLDIFPPPWYFPLRDNFPSIIFLHMHCANVTTSWSQCWLKSAVRYCWRVICHERIVVITLVRSGDDDRVTGRGRSQSASATDSRRLTYALLFCCVCENLKVSSTVAPHRDDIAQGCTWSYTAVSSRLPPACFSCQWQKRTVIVHARWPRRRLDCNKLWTTFRHRVCTTGMELVSSRHQEPSVVQNESRDSSVQLQSLTLTNMAFTNSSRLCNGSTPSIHPSVHPCIY